MISKRVCVILVVTIVIATGLMATFGSTFIPQTITQAIDSDKSAQEVSEVIKEITKIITQTITSEGTVQEITQTITSEGTVQEITQTITSEGTVQDEVTIIQIDREKYDEGCVDRVLGMAIFDEIFHMGRKPTSEELTKIERCVINVGGSGERDNISESSQYDDYNNSEEKDELVWTQRKCLRDDHSHALGPDCNVPPTPLSPGVIAADLIDVLPPEPAYELSTSIDCETFEGGQCAELRWEPVSDLKSGEFTVIQISPTNPDIIFAGIDSNDMSIYKSTDAGNTWQLFDVTGHTSGIAINPVNPDIVLYTSLEAPVRRTVDGGWNWKSVLGPSEEEVMDTGNIPFTAIAFSPDDPNVVYTTSVPGPSRGGFNPPVEAKIFMSNNAGLDWTLVGTCECGSIKFLTVQPGDPEVIWTAGDGGVRVSRDGGRNWSENLIEVAIREYLNASPERGIEATAIGVAVSPGDSQIILAGSTDAGIYRSADGGESWIAVNTGLETSLIHHIMFAPSDPDVVYAATHKGVYRSEDAGQTWVPRNGEMKYNFVTPIAVHPQDANVVYSGTATEVYTTHPRHYNPGLHEGEGLYKTYDGGQTWYRSDEGIYEAKIAQMSGHPLVPFNLWVGGESGRGAFFTPDGGETWLFSPFNGGHYPMVFEFTRSFPTIQYLTAWMPGGELSKSTDGGRSWFLLTSKIEEGISELTKLLGLVVLFEEPKYHLHGLAVAPSDSNIVYVGSVDDYVYQDVGFTLFGAHIFKSVDAGESYTEMSNGFPIETPTAINSIIIHPENPDIVYIMTTLHESLTAIGVYKTTDGAQSWIEMNNGLNTLTNDIQIDPLSPDTLYAATETGVYKTINGAETWHLASDGLPIQSNSDQYGPVIDLAIDPINPLVLYAITPEHVYRTKNGGGNWYQVDLGLPLNDSEDPISAGKAPLMEHGESMGHVTYGGHFAQDRTLEIDATGRVVYVAIKLSADDSAVRHLYRAVLDPLLSVKYQFELQEESISVESTSHVYNMVYDQNIEELQFIVAGPPGTNGLTKISIPDQFVSLPFYVRVDGVEIHYTNDSGVIVFEYAHRGRSEVSIGSTTLNSTSNKTTADDTAYTVTQSTETYTASTNHERIIITLPFVVSNPPDGLQPMGETINHEAKYGGHPGIDFQWGNVDSPPEIYTVARGVIVEIIQWEYWEDWSITVSHSGFDKEYFTRYSHLGSYDTALEIGTEVDRHTFIGYALHPPNVEDPNMHAIHWEFGKMDEQGRYDIRLCPMTYFDDDSRELLEEVWEISPYSDKDQFPHICSGFYQGKDDSEGQPRPSSDDN